LEAKKIYTEQDCAETGDGMHLAGRVILLHAASLPERLQNAVHQLYFCIGGPGSIPNWIGRELQAVSLFDGELVNCNRKDVLGIAKPEVLSEKARLQLSQIHPPDSEISKEPEFFGYCFLPNGRYPAGVPLSDELEVRGYVDIQRVYQHKLMICDQDDCCVLEIIDGKIIYPTQEILKAHQKEKEQNGGMELKL
jgi:hypothetical protein